MSIQGDAEVGGERRFLPVARDGWRFILPVAAVSAAAFAGGWLVTGAALAVLATFVVYFFRDPERETPEGDDLAVSPADGKVVSIGEIDHPGFPEGRALRVGIFLSVFNVHINRAPVQGSVRSTRHKPGRFRNAMLDRSSDENEHNIIAMDSSWGYMEIKQIAGAIARRIVCSCRAGDSVARGQRIGLIRFGSRTEAYLPIGTEIWVRKGDRVRGGATPLGRVRASASTS
jgi:phosphatidylserine decarboxylase